MLQEKTQLPDLYYLKHRHDDDVEFVSYEDNILTNSLSTHVYKNDRMNNFLSTLQKMVALMFDQTNIIKNWKNYMVDKWYFKHKN